MKATKVIDSNLSNEVLSKALMQLLELAPEMGLDKDKFIREYVATAVFSNLKRACVYNQMAIPVFAYSVCDICHKYKKHTQQDPLSKDQMRRYVLHVLPIEANPRLRRLYPISISNL